MGRRKRKLGLAVAALAVLAACQPVKPPPPGGSPPPPPGTPTLTWTSFVSGLSNPWDVGFLDDGTMFFTERGGNVKVRSSGGTITARRERTSRSSDPTSRQSARAG